MIAKCTNTIKLNDVKIGDLVFSYIGKKGDWPTLLSPAGHVAICTEESQFVAALITHEVDGSVKKGTFTTVLQPSATSTDDYAGQQLRILRCTNQSLAQNAAALALCWNDFLLPFGSPGRTQATAFENHYKDGAELQAALRLRFDQMGKYRAIKYAARRAGFLCYPTDGEGDGVGLFCSQFVTICYQVAGLLDVVDAAWAGDSQLRVCDKRMTKGDRKALEQRFTGTTLDYTQFCNYADMLANKDPYSLGETAMKPQETPKRKGIEYVPSLMFWKVKHGSISNFPWTTKLTEGMLVDCKIVMPQGLFESLIRCNDWEDKGALVDPLAKEEFERVKQLGDDLMKQRDLNAMRRLKQFKST